jgi:hypothetical protein
MFGFGYSNGNIGIGTTVPREQLDVSGNIKFSGNIYRDDILLSAANTSIIRKTFIASDTQSVFDLSYNGIIYSEDSEVQVFVNGYKYTYIDSTTRDYNFVVIHDASYNFTTFRITLNDPVLYGDIVDISVLPGLIFTLEKPGVYQSGGVLGTEASPIDGGVIDINISLVPNAFIELSTGNNPLTINFLPVTFDSSYVGKKGKIYLRERSPDGRLLVVDSRVYFSSLYQAGYTSDVSGNPQIDVLEYEIIKSNLVVGIYEKRVEAYYWDGVNKRLGIGVSNPQYPLHVIGDTRIQGNLIVNGTTTMVDTNVSTTERIEVINDGTGPALRVTQTGVQPIADFCDDSSDNVVVRIDDGGNVGIGTTIPKKKLDVVGDISCNWMYGKVRWTDISASPMQEVPVGTVVVVDSSGTVLDGTYIPVDGRTLNRVDYPELANAYNIPVGQATFSIPTTSQYQSDWTQNDSSKATYIKNKPNIVGDASGNVVVSGNISAGNLGMFRNRIINGDMRINQRGVANVFYQNANNGLYLSIDRFLMGVGGGNTSLNVIHDTDVPLGQGFSKSLKIINNNVTSDSANDVVEIQQRIEGYNVEDLLFGSSYAYPITISFWAKTSLANATYSVSIRNNFARSYIIPFSPTSSWSYFTYTIPGDTTGTWAKDNTIGMVLTFSLTARTNLRSSTTYQWVSGNLPSFTSATNIGSAAGATFHVTGVQLEKGTISTPFEFRPLGIELQLCQRYYEKTFDLTTAPANNLGNGVGEVFFSAPNGGGGFSGNMYFSHSFKIPKRIAPVGNITAYNCRSITAGTFSTYAAGVRADTTPYFELYTQNCVNGYFQAANVTLAVGAFIISAEL